MRDFLAPVSKTNMVPVVICSTRPRRRPAPDQPTMRKSVLRGHTRLHEKSAKSKTGEGSRGSFKMAVVGAVVETLCSAVTLPCYITVTGARPRPSCSAVFTSTYGLTSLTHLPCRSAVRDVNGSSLTHLPHETQGKTRKKREKERGAPAFDVLGFD